MKSRPLAIALAVIALLLAAACGGSSESGTSKPVGEPRIRQGEAAAPPERPAGREAEAPGPAETGAPDAERDSAPGQVSTFALDVDTASYGHARRVLAEGGRPDPAQVRPEEFVNSFRQDYAEPGGDGFAVHLDGARLPGSGAALVRVGLQTRGADPETRRPANLTFVVDVSGSMAEPGRLDLVRESLHGLVDQLGPGDRVAVVAFSDEAETLVPMTPATGRAELHAAVERLTVRQSTNLEAGLAEGYAEAARSFRSMATNRVILLSDGLANTGETSWQGILDRVKESAGRRITLLCVGVGREYGDALMEQLADNGDGAAVYVGSAGDAREVFAERLTTTLDLRARDAKAQVAFNPSVVESYRLIGYENRELAAEDFRDDARDGGEIGPGHSVTALYRVRLRAGASGQLATATVRWQDPDTRHPAEASRSLDERDLSGALWEGTSPRFQVDVVAASFAEHLRSREATAGLGLRELGRHATRLAETTEDPMVTELAGLIDRAAALG
ncbi:von Willebrand factor type A domain-containing protein [Planomonospora sp. ID91781]|uniref:vWA domain-containing protein n=1 Tax=Planomonospora sp. ID91781 TaxID=2738135 RepID=UPI0018C3857C|nr:von Willebrand factor type A domain-containing protein [Planomonospora sp. ID91781]MBG0824735.1 von Willebrand factor type A domain-containing protein [Planomonospora sp. ID91781]